MATVDELVEWYGVEGNQGNDSMLEKVADFEHRQWAHWTRYMLDNLTPENIEHWKRQCNTDYSDLSENEKDSDRKWAKEAILLMQTERQKEAKEIVEKYDVARSA